MAKVKTVQKVSKNFISRRTAEKAIAAGKDPEQFMSHPNYHCKRKAWVKMGKPIMGSADEHAKFLESIHYKTVSVEMVPNPSADTP